ncbi:OmpH family outer membrane protein [Selenomonas caprae]|uniref:Periplasmic chaperone for outer membrane proteins Skp n=2 Tax=Selenomonas TaxID=970 RepID=A0A1I3DLP6_SELRU|nr:MULTISPECIES: OmpH family outer membrane protein [Selenomonas]MBQ1890366.1 OmpH family outer membrane protein [Selenomonas sp.]TYZ30956.1 OmpH family outer membrane protein [Selenomonas caprae]SFH87664.1 periplasmic chaperone for outer membrane proteins Skp [Selenomonas ruminantium]
MKLRKKSTALLMAAFASMMLMSGCGQAKIGYIDGERVTKEAPQIASLVEEGNQKLQEAQTQAEADLKQKLQENPNMSQEEAQKLQMDTQRKLQGLNQSYALQLRQKVDAALAKVTKDKKLDAVVNNSQEQPIAISGATDVTDDVIKELQ